MAHLNIFMAQFNIYLATYNLFNDLFKILKIYYIFIITS